jgi:hypothetical protein
MTSFPERIKQAATTFPGATSTAWVQYRVTGFDVEVRMQAPEIMKEFKGGVKFGIGRSKCSPYTASFYLLLPDPKGILFFRSISDLDLVGNIKVQNRKYPVTGSLVVVETDFSGPGPSDPAFARVLFCCCSGFTWN